MPHRIKIKHLTDNDLFDQDEIIWASSSSGTTSPCLSEDYWDYYHSLVYDYSFYYESAFYDYETVSGLCKPIYSKEINRRILVSELLGDFDGRKNTIENILKNK